MKKTFVLAAALVVLLAACGGGDEEPAAQSTPTPAATTEPPATPAPPPSEAPPASEAPASQAPNPAPTNGKQTPEEAAQAFVADWAELDRASAAGYATQRAINKAFSGQPPQAEFTGCIEEEMQFWCGYYYEGGALTVVVEDSDAYGHIVTDIFYVAD